MNELSVTLLLQTPTVGVRDVACDGACRHRSPSECAAATHLVFPYRGAYVRHVGRQDMVAEANQVVFFNQDQEYAISHPVGGGDACLSVSIGDDLLAELSPAEQLEDGGLAVFRRPARGVDPGVQALAAQLRRGLARGALEPLQAESLTLDLVRRALGERASPARAASYGRHKLADRAKLALASDPARRWTLGEIAGEVGVSPVYLTQVFAKAEGQPLYRYQLRLRLACALDRLGDCEDLTDLALDLGFSSHSHFGAAFRQHYGQSPGDFRRTVAPPRRYA
ncbi:AraC family transcriptional regulator [Caulobacter sp. UNC279MFTsu5.1]|uniref:helix-turn-helix transcriptional regulator n=1 Tax=Caulobacter sp. UNC279MFTsu5.1 TaxID=1502775 RepID=UPI0008DEECD6|nr:AraC family transcriptional regulator [Caulobacter sp. UNC279MFTsu5.1]SFJ50897.1 AraC-type DNA-binding protein [Caulobacter sp. UNC279MFTsu5.1]